MKRNAITIEMSGPLALDDLRSLEDQLNVSLKEYLHINVVPRQQRISPDTISAITGVISAAAAILQIYLMLRFSDPQRSEQEQEAKERARVLYKEKRISSVEIIEIHNLDNKGASDRLLVNFKEENRFFRLSCHQEQVRDEETIIVDLEEE
jgi:hypothetical protein